VTLTADKKIAVDQHMVTNLAGVFAAGDITGHAPQVAVATGQGTLAALSALKYLR
jgi:thioredoxin reductase (NADPH)